MLRLFASITRTSAKIVIVDGSSSHIATIEKLKEKHSRFLFPRSSANIHRTSQVRARIVGMRHAGKKRVCKLLWERM
jgi:hypothetical protein